MNLLNIVLAEKWLNDQQETIKIKSIQVTEPGMSEYFQNSKGTESLQAIQALSKCVVWVSSSNTSSASSSTSHASTIQNMMVRLAVSYGKDYGIRHWKNNLVVYRKLRYKRKIAASRFGTKTECFTLSL